MPKKIEKLAKCITKALFKMHYFKVMKYSQNNEFHALPQKTVRYTTISSANLVTYMTR